MRLARPLPAECRRVVVDELTLGRRVTELAAALDTAYGGQDVRLVTVLRGGVFFLADLCRAMRSDVRLDFMAVSSYGTSTKSSGVVRILKDLDEGIEGRNVLVVEDILDTGLTLKYLLKNLASRSPKSLEVVTLLSKEGKQRVPIDCKYVGFDIEDEFVVGYGLDYAERYRNLPFVGVLKPAIYSE